MNKITLSGEVVSTPELSHETHREEFYKFYISSLRTSREADVLPCIVSKVFLNEIKEKGLVKLVGEIRTFNDHTSEKRKLNVYVFVQDVLPYEEGDENFVELQGFMCKTTNWRMTPKGKKIADFTAACNRRLGKSDYIPSIAWGRGAHKVSQFPVGTEFLLEGRLQSRTYTKRYLDGTTEEKVAYEISVSNIDEVFNSMEEARWE